MNGRSQVSKKGGWLSASPAARVLQRKCGCGNHTVAGAPCQECEKGKGRLQRKATNAKEREEVPPIVSAALRSSGHPLDGATRSFFESRFAHDFSQVRVHTDTTASESAEAVSAQAYTIGRDILFAAGQYAPGTIAGRGLLAHELTHVVQQAGSAGPSISSAGAEREADQNSSRLAAGQAPGMVSNIAEGSIQRDKKDEKKEKKKPVETEVKMERTGKAPEKKGDPVKDSFKIEAEMTAPLTDELTFGAISFLDEMKISGAGGALGEPLGAEYEDLKFKIAMTLAKLELSNLKDKADALKRGKLSLGSKLTAVGGPTFSFDPGDVTGSLGLSLATKASATTANLIPSSRGKATLGTSLSNTLSLTQPLGVGAVKPKIESGFGVTADFESRASKHPLMTLGGLLGDKAKFTAGLEGEASGSYTPQRDSDTPGKPPTPATTTGKLSGGASIGLTGTSKNVERFVKLKLTGNVSLNHQAGTATTFTEMGFLGLFGGVKF